MKPITALFDTGLKSSFAAITSKHNGDNFKVPKSYYNNPVDGIVCNNVKAIGLVVPGRKKGLSFNGYAMHFCVWFSGSIPLPATILN